MGTISVAEPVGVRVYNFTVADDHTYFVEGFGGASNAAPLDAVWVHNTCAGAGGGGAADESPRPDSGPAEAEQVDKEGEAAAGAAGAGAAGTAENAAVDVQFGTVHSMPHFVGTGVDQSAVEGAIRSQLQRELGAASVRGPFMGRINVGGQTVVYRGFGLSDGTVNIGTYYPVR